MRHSIIMIYITILALCAYIVFVAKYKTQSLMIIVTFSSASVKDSIPSLYIIYASV